MVVGLYFLGFASSSKKNVEIEFISNKNDFLLLVSISLIFYRNGFRFLSESLFQTFYPELYSILALCTVTQIWSSSIVQWRNMSTFALKFLKKIDDHLSFEEAA